jgi:enoyl-CoA hydratase
MPDFETIAVETNHREGIATVELARPEKRNAINRRMVQELGTATAALASDPAVRAIVFHGRGAAFAAGADISELAAYDCAAEPLDHIETIQKTYNAIEETPKPTIAAIHGFAFGGGLELALCCDFRIVTRTAQLGVPEIKIGVLPGAGGTQRLSQMLPTAIAKRMILLGEPLIADAALGYGLVDEVVDGDSALEPALTLARRFRELPPLAVRAGKLLVHGAKHHGLHTGIEAERQAMAFLFQTDDRLEGMRAFLEKRRPAFRGR